MSVIEQAAKRLEELRKAGILTPRPVGRRGSESGQQLRAGPLLHGTEEGRENRTVAAGVVPRSLGAGEQSPAKTVSKAVAIDLLRLSAMGMVTPTDPRSRVAEEYRSIKRPLIRNAQGKSAIPLKNGNLVMITSALPGEGKSTCAANLAISIAMELDNTVLLVDADVAKPSIPAMLGLTPERGLLDVVAQESMDLSDVLLRTNIDKLSLLPSGSPNPRATEMLASETMERLLNEMSKRYADRIIVFDSPPLLLTNEARALAAHMGQVVLVVEAQQTTQAAVKQALAAIESAPVKLLLLNKVQYGRGGSYYGYGHYGHGEYASYGYGT